MTIITATDEPNDVDVAIEQGDGRNPQYGCPVQRALQRDVERLAVVFTASWHLGAQDKVLATKGVALPADVVAFIAAFDAWAKAVRHRMLMNGEDLETAKAAAAGRPAGLQFSVELPSKPMVEPVPA